MATRLRRSAAKTRHREHTGTSSRVSKPVAADSQPVALLRTSKGIRATFFDNAAIDQLFAIVTALTGELSVALDRIDTLEQLLEQHGTLPRAAVETHQHSDEAAATRMRRREELLQRVFEVFEHATPRPDR